MRSANIVMRSANIVDEYFSQLGQCPAIAIPSGRRQPEETRKTELSRQLHVQPEQRPSASLIPRDIVAIRYDSLALRAEREAADRAVVNRFTAERRARRVGIAALLLLGFVGWFVAPGLLNDAPPHTSTTLASYDLASGATARTPTTSDARVRSRDPNRRPDIAFGNPRQASKRIEDIDLGDCVAGRNPVRAQVEDVHPDPATWREIHLRLDKSREEQLWVDLLRPVEWLEYYEAEVGNEIYLDLPEMGAAGDAEVLAILPCPKIDSGDGASVTGVFRHEVVNGQVVDLQLEGQDNPTRVTANHPYWSVDRLQFVPAGELRAGERLDTMTGGVSVASVDLMPYSGLLYNLETTEHVYRVDELGTLVHNAYADVLRSSMKKAGVYGNIGDHAHHIVLRGRYPNNPAMARLADGARAILSRNKIGIDSHWNGVFLRSVGSGTAIRSANHSTLHTKAYLQAVYDRLRTADSNGTAAVLQALQGIRRDLSVGVFPH